MTLRQFTMLAAVAFGLGLAVAFSLRMSSDALSLLVGVAAGWAAGLPAYACLFRRVPALPRPASRPVTLSELPARDFREIESGVTDPRRPIILARMHP